MSLPDLEIVNLRATPFDGVIPAEVGQLTRFYNLKLDVNTLSGPIPSEIGNLRQLRKLDVEGNMFEDVISSEVERL